LKKISNYLQERMGVDCHKFARSTGVAHDIGLAGDDAVEFFDRYEKEV